MTREDALELERIARGGLCGGCLWARLVRSARGSGFLLCRHPELPKYPPQPLTACPGHRPRA